MCSEGSDDRPLFREDPKYWNPLEREEHVVQVLNGLFKTTAIIMALFIRKTIVHQ